MTASKSQTSMCLRACRLATLSMLNNRIAQYAPDRAVPQDRIANIGDDEIDKLRDVLILTWNDVLADAHCAVRSK
ncbi:MAG TPA: hypothetical protein VFQ88_14120 [Nevskiaceae bacterium]|nr:hypothetical protein [Nevskiaceae bacterium]